MVGRIVFLLTLLLFPPTPTFSTGTKLGRHHHYLKLRLVRNPSLTPRQALLHDTIRLASLPPLSSSTITKPSFTLASPLVSGVATGSGQYFVRLHIGTPPQSILLVADTGSDLVWVRCSACRTLQCSLRHPPNSVFFPRLSTTFSPFHCYHPSCRLVPFATTSSRCSNATLHTPCRYSYSYADRSSSSGFFSHDVASFLLRQSTFPSPLSFGCAFNTSGASFQSSSVHGVMGLGRGPTSFPSQLLLRRKRRHLGVGGGGDTFSYCLKDYTLSPIPRSYLLIGDNLSSHHFRHQNLSYTPLLLNPFSPTFYYVCIEGVTVDNTPLAIDPRVFALDSETGAGGTVIDSGTTLSFLPEPAYRQILAAMEKIVRLPRVTFGGITGKGSEDPNPAVGPSAVSFDLCVNVTGLGGKQLPRLRLRMRGGALFSPPPRNYYLEVEEGVRCLALQPLAAPASGGGFGVVGNLMQQGFLFVFDRHLNRLGFSRSGCTA